MGQVEATLLREIGEAYTSPSERAAYRAGMSTAAAVCDVAKGRIKLANSHRGRVTNVGQAMADVVSSCGDEIWRLRDLIKVEK